MKVYIVMDHDYERDTILGVFSTREAAEHAKRERSDYQQYDARTVDVTDDDKYDTEAWVARNIAREWADSAIHEHEVEPAAATEGPK